MPLRIDEQRRQELLKQPESGMGYQILQADDTIVVLNAEIVLPLADSASHLEWVVKIISLPEDVRRGLIADLSPYDGDLTAQAHGSYLSTTRAKEVFVRYSAFFPDRRLLSDGSVLPGTYATTRNDVPLVPSGLAALGRYALPNPSPAVYKYTLNAPIGTVIRCGTSAPKFGQAGGGVEILFTAGSPAGSTSGPAKIPER